MRCQTIINYGIKDHPDYGPQPCFVVKFLEDRAFNAGFRVLNPEYNASPDRIDSDTKALLSLLEELDHSDPTDFHNYKANKPMNPREHRVWKAANGLDR